MFCERNASQVREIETSGHCENVRLTAEELANFELPIDTTRPLTFVVPQFDSEEDEGDVPLDELQAYAPM
jgi:hypothetical protein